MRLKLINLLEKIFFYDFYTSELFLIFIVVERKEPLTVDLLKTIYWKDRELQEIVNRAVDLEFSYDFDKGVLTVSGTLSKKGFVSKSKCFFPDIDAFDNYISWRQLYNQRSALFVKFLGIFGIKKKP